MPNNVESCRGCDGKGWFDDTTYDRCGSLTKCNRCFGTGLNAAAVALIVKTAMAPFLKPSPKE